MLVKNSISINAKELNGPVKILDLGCGDAVIAQHFFDQQDQKFVYKSKSREFILDKWKFRLRKIRSNKYAPKLAQNKIIDTLSKKLLMNY